jgi:hypothetical protein
MWEQMSYLNSCRFRRLRYIPCDLGRHQNTSCSTYTRRIVSVVSGGGIQPDLDLFPQFHRCTSCILAYIRHQSGIPGRRHSPVRLIPQPETFQPKCVHQQDRDEWQTILNKDQFRIPTTKKRAPDPWPGSTTSIQRRVYTYLNMTRYSLQIYA